eukprot:m51a1_g13976 putative pleckstrin domain-containing protein (983) ;mRNA; r:999259-1003482
MEDKRMAFRRFTDENEAKRTSAEKRCAEEQGAALKAEQELQAQQEELKRLVSLRESTAVVMESLGRYQKYLMEVVDANDEFGAIGEVLTRHETLQNAQHVSSKQQQRSKAELEAAQADLAALDKRYREELFMLEGELAAQKQRQDAERLHTEHLESNATRLLAAAMDRTRVHGEILMSIENLYEKLQQRKLVSSAKEGIDPLVRLQRIQDHLADLNDVVVGHPQWEKEREAHKEDKDVTASVKAKQSLYGGSGTGSAGTPPISSHALTPPSRCSASPSCAVPLGTGLLAMVGPPTGRRADSLRPTAAPPLLSSTSSSPSSPHPPSPQPPPPRRPSNASTAHVLTRSSSMREVPLAGGQMSPLKHVPPTAPLPMTPNGSAGSVPSVSPEAMCLSSPPHQRRARAQLGIEQHVAITRGQSEIALPLVEAQVAPRPRANAQIPPPDDRSHKLRKRAKVAQEIHSTEATYLHQISVMLTFYMEPMRKFGIPQDEIVALFSNVEVINTLHQKFMTRLSERVEAWGSESVIGDLFQEAGWIKLYKYYINNYDNALATLARVKDKYPEFRSHVEKIDHTDLVGGLPIESYLVVPVQRIPRYVLLLQEMLKATPADHPDVELLTAAIVTIKALADYINERKRVSENQDKLVETRSKWKKYKGDLLSNPDRLFLREIPVSNGWSKVVLWLFNDIAVVTSSERSLTGKYVFKYQINLQTAAFQPDTTAVGSFKLLGPDAALAGTCDLDDLRELESVVERAHDCLIRSAFRRTVLIDPAEVSQQFLDFQQEEYKVRRKKTLTDLIESEREYLETIDHARTVVFVDAAGCMAIPPCFASAFTEIGDFLEHACTIHAELLSRLAEREKAWETIDKVSDIFLDLLPELQPYARFVTRCKDYRALLDQAISSEPSFGSWLKRIEEWNQVSLVPLLERILKRVPEYYLLLQDMLQNTPKKSADFDDMTRAALEMDTLKTALTRRGESKHAAILGIGKK